MDYLVNIVPSFAAIQDISPSVLVSKIVTVLFVRYLALISWYVCLCVAPEQFMNAA